MHKMSEKTRIMLVNAQSMKNKEHALSEHMDELKLIAWELQRHGLQAVTGIKFGKV